jgi:hypothetical protein
MHCGVGRSKGDHFAVEKRAGEWQVKAKLVVAEEGRKSASNKGDAVE